MCFKCGKIGHKATECHYSGSGSNSQLKPTEKSFTCFSCGQPGHISPNCLNKSRDDKADIKKDNGKKPAKIIKNSLVSISEEECLNYVKGRIDNKDIQVLLDTGAQISVMPEEMVPDTAKTGGIVKTQVRRGLGMWLK